MLTQNFFAVVITLAAVLLFLLGITISCGWSLRF